MTGRLIRRFLREQDGIALVIAVATMSVLAIATTGIIVAGTVNGSTALAATQARSAFAVAQAALAYGEGMVYGDVASSPMVMPPTTTQNLPAQPNGATGTYVVSTSDGVTWHVVATGTVGGVTRTVSADVTPTQTVTTQQLAIWKYLYADERSASAPCVSGGSVITMPILTNGNFCLSGGNTKILNNLEVNGNLTTSGGAQIGSATSPIAKLAITGTCAVNGPAQIPGNPPCDGAHNSTYATTVGRTLDVAAQMPTVDFQAAYAAQAGLAQSGCPANLFDNDTTLNNSDTAIGGVMFGPADYDCFLGSNELRWNHSTKSLFVHGTFYFDGTLTAGTIGNVVYTGQASMYFTGGVSFSGSTSTFCGIANCTQSWDPGTNGIIMVAQCWSDATGARLITTGCVDLSGGTRVQFGAYVATNYNVSGGSGNMGPILCDTFTISGGTNLLIPFNTFPPGTPAPGTTTIHAGGPPANWSG